MVAVAIPVTSIGHGAGVLVPGYTDGDSVNGHTFANDGNTCLEMQNTAGAPATVTISFDISAYQDGQAPAAKTYTIPATSVHKVWGFPVRYYGATVAFTTSASTTTKFRAFKKID